LRGGVDGSDEGGRRRQLFVFEHKRTGNALKHSIKIIIIIIIIIIITK
jgi:hypothetical protein